MLVRAAQARGGAEGRAQLEYLVRLALTTRGPAAVFTSPLTKRQVQLPYKRWVRAWTMDRRKAYLSTPGITHVFSEIGSECRSGCTNAYVFGTASRHLKSPACPVVHLAARAIRDIVPGRSCPWEHGDAGRNNDNTRGFTKPKMQKSRHGHTRARAFAA